MKLLHSTATSSTFGRVSSRTAILCLASVQFVFQWSATRNSVRERGQQTASVNAHGANQGTWWRTHFSDSTFIAAALWYLYDTCAHTSDHRYTLLLLPRSILFARARRVQFAFQPRRKFHSLLSAHKLRAFFPRYDPARHLPNTLNEK